MHTTDLDGSTQAPYVVAVPDLIGAIVAKSFAAQRSARDRDLTDIGHLLQCAVATGVTLPAPSSGSLDYEKVAAYLHGPFLSGRSATTARRRLVQDVVLIDPRPDPFLNL